MLLALIVLVVVARFAGEPLAARHVRQVTGRADVGATRCWNCHGPGGYRSHRGARPHPSPRFLAADEQGGVLFASLGPAERLARVDLGSRLVRLSEPLGAAPRGIAVSPDDSLVAVALSEADEVALLDSHELTVRQRIAVGVDPAGVAFAAGGRLIVANAGSQNVTVLDLEAEARETRLAAGREPYAVAVTPDGTAVAVVSRMVDTALPDQLPSSEITFLDPVAGRVTRRVAVPSTHLAEDAAFTPDGRYLLVPALRTRNLLPILQVARGWVVSSVLAVVERSSGRVSLLPLNELNRTFSDPTGVAVDPEGRWVWVASGGSNQAARLALPELLAAADGLTPQMPEDFSLTRRYLEHRFPTATNPRDVLAVGGVVAVAERLNDSVAWFTPEGELLERLPVGDPVPLDAPRRGDAVFHDASYAFQGSFSCRSCHPDGHTDGLTYDFDIDGVGRNILLNRSLRGVAGTAPFKWGGLNPTLQRQCGPRFAMVLTRADPFPEPQLEDLVAFLESLPPPRPDPGAGRVAELAAGSRQRGRQIFERRARKDGTEIPASGRCSTCHSGPHFSNLLKADVGTGSGSDSGGEFDVPHLTGIGSKAPYLHDGRARTLEEIWTLPGVGDLHGVVSDLNKAELNDLVQYLKGL
jgi:DNA-binding beta-propeller fold protein YncE/cytochrome c553